MTSIRSRAPTASSPVVRRVMQANVGRETGIEQTLRCALHRNGLRFRKDAAPVCALRCKADIVFTRFKVCVFVDGCFWHGCPKHFRPPKANRAWWLEKIRDNRARDRRQSALLAYHGWTVLRFWEHNVKSQLTTVVADVRRTLASANRQALARKRRSPCGKQFWPCL